MTIDLLADARAQHGDLIELRRALHREPEIGLDLPRTQKRVLAALDGLPLEITAGPAGLTSVVGVLRGGRSTGRAVLLRADMDGLPVTEETGLDFAAGNGAMHACGHDLHTSMLVGAARLLSAHRDSLGGDVVFMFQPGEEGYDGAGHMIEAGVLDAAGTRPEAAFFMHVTSSGFPSGTIAVRPGPMMSAADVLHVSVVGSGGHASAPHRAQDPIAVAAEMVTALQTLVTRQFDMFDPIVVTVGSFHAGSQHNIIPDRANFEATVRSFSAKHQTAIGDRAVRLCRGIAEAHGLRAEVEWQPLYPVTVNDADQSAFLADTAADLLGEPAGLTLPNPHSGSEDFSRVLEAVPGAMAFLGATPEGADPDTAPFNHSPLAVFDEAVLPSGAALYAKLAIDRLGVTSALLGPADIRALAERLGVRPTKKLGQNFLHDANTIRRIVRTAELAPGETVLEVGPGLGSLTLGLLEAGHPVTAVEIDPVLAGELTGTVADRLPGAALRVVVADALRVADVPGAPTALVANLPYNVAVPVVLHLLAVLPALERALVMVQAEVADRLAAAPGTKTYGVPSVKAAWYAQATRVGTVPRTVFWPVPNVDSGLVRLVRRDPPVTTATRGEVFAVVDAAFAQRRKTLRAALAGWAGSAAAAEVALGAAGIDPSARGETLDVAQFARLAEHRPSSSRANG